MGAAEQVSVVVPVEEWSHEQAQGAARALSMLLVGRRGFRSEQTYQAAARLLMEVTIRLEETTGDQAASVEAASRVGA